MEINLNESGERCGDLGAASEVFTLGSFDPEATYTIDCASIVAEHQSGGEDSGDVRLPVRSVGRISGRYFYATDARFEQYPGCVCVFPAPTGGNDEDSD